MNVIYIAGLTLDLETDSLYWISQEKQTIYYCNITSDKDCQPQELRKAPILAPISMTLYNKLDIKSNSKEKVIFYANNTNIFKVSLFV